MHPASRGRLCAKGPATITQIHDPDRILYPMKRSGPRGGGKWARTSWDEVLETFGARIRKAFQENRGEEVMYHVGRPGHDFIMERTLAGVGHRRPQLAHECLFVVGAARLFALALRRPAIARSRQCALYSAALGASRVGTLFQSARAAHYRRKNGGRETCRHGPAPFEHGEHGRLLDAELSRHRGGRAAGDGDGDPWRESLRRRVRQELDELGRTRSRWIFREGAKFRRADRGAEAALREVHSGVCRKRKWSEGGDHRQDRARDRDRRQPLRVASVARQRVGQSWRMAIGARA